MSIDTAVPTSLTFLCLARNCESTLPIFFSYLVELQSTGFMCRVIIGENGSRDKTRALIQEASGANVRLLDTSSMAKASRRLIRTAIGRQALMDAARDAGWLDSGYICVADLDNVMISPPSPQGIRSAIERLRSDSNIFAVGATSTPVYYDILTLRAEDHDYTNMEAELTEAKKHPLTYFRYHKVNVYRNQRLMTRDEPIYCTSTFNGFCIYNADDFRQGTYISDNLGDECEHVNLSLSVGMATGKRMVIAPELKIKTPSDHAPVCFLRFWFDRVKKALDKYRL